MQELKKVQKEIQQKEKINQLQLQMQQQMLEMQAPEYLRSTGSR